MSSHSSSFINQQKFIVPVTYSTIDKNFLKERVESEYDLKIDRIRFYRRSLNDTYLIETNLIETENSSGSSLMKKQNSPNSIKNLPSTYKLMVYRKWRTESDVAFEIEWLKYLNDKNAPVMILQPKKDGSLYTCLEAPEGKRCYALFPFLEGIQHRPLNENTARMAGIALAQLHLLSEDFHSSHQRFTLDAHHLIEEPMQGILDWYQNQPLQNPSLQVALEKIKSAAENTKKIINQLDKSNSRIPGFYGPCHGDTHFANAMFRDDKNTIWLDFECSGLGFRVYDLAIFYWALKIKWIGWRIEYTDTDDKIWSGFLSGYQSLRPLSQLEFDLLPTFLIARSIWALGLHPNNIDDWDCQSASDDNEFLMQHLPLFENPAIPGNV